MVCIRCKMVVKDELNKLGLTYGQVELGEVEVIDTPTELQIAMFKNQLVKFGLELIDDHKSILIKKIKDVIVEMVHYTEEIPKVNFSVFLSEKLQYDYTYLANLFSVVMGTTIEHFLIMHKIERVKELLVYEHLTLTEIAYRMHYSSVAHLANQFKKTTGFTTTQFKNLKSKQLRDLDTLCE